MKNTIDAASYVLFESSDVRKMVEKISSLTGSKLSNFFIDLSDAFMDIYDDDSERSDAKEFSKELLDLSKIAKRVG